MTKHDRLQRDIIQYFNALPYTFAFPTHGYRNRPVYPGVTDIICCHRGGMVVVEVKVGGDRMREEQDEFGRRVVCALGVHGVVESFEDAITIMGGRGA